jgi:curved DNA-binding protein CbpA
LYDLLGALPGDDAEGLRTAFRRAAKAAHPDINRDDPDAARRFRELMRAYEIMTDADQRTTYDELLSIALHPPVTKSTRVYESVRKFASNTMAATIISGLLVAGYTLFGHFSTPPGAAEILPNGTANRPERIAVAAPYEAAIEPRRASPAEVDSVKAMIVMASMGEARAPASRRIEAAPGFALDNWLARRDPILAVAYLDRDIILYRSPKFDRAFDTMAQVRNVAETGRPKISAPAPRRVSTARIPEMRGPEVRVPLPPRRAPMVAALTP